ncbi:MAG TPA: patatin-like phospholipase family protein, partial [Acidimicrobiales bacterium]
MTSDLPRPIAFVLSGGGPLGAIQVGMLQALAEHGLRPDLVVGVSAGAINGALLAADPDGAAERLARTWAALDRHQVFPGRTAWHLLTLRRHPNYIFPSTGLEAAIRREAGSLRIEDLPVRFAAVAVDAASGQPVLFERGPLAPVLLASSAIPAVYPPVEIDGTLYYDGGIAGNVPLRWGLDLGAASIVVLDCRISQDPTRVPRTVGQAVAFSLAVMIGRHAHEELERVSAEVPVVYLPGPSGARRSIFDFSHTGWLQDT